MCNGNRSGKLTVDGTCPARALSLRKKVEGRADDVRYFLPTLSSERIGATHRETLGPEVVAFVYCYVERESVHALIVSTSKSHNLLITLR